MKLEERFLNGADEVRRLAMQTLFERLDSLCEGAIAVDQQARIVCMNVAAQALGVSWATLYEKIAQLGLAPRERQLSG